jgi:glycosyltransferase involved in cell wall biosynthesis
MTPKLMSRCRSIICCSAAERDLFVRDYPSIETHTVVIPPAIGDPQGFAVEPFKIDEPIVLSTGRLDAYKQVDKLIRAVGRLDPSPRLVVTGEGPARKKLEEEVRANGLECRTDFLGYVSDEDLRRWQRTANVVVSLSTHESFGLALAEALVAGSRVVASDILAHREMADMVGGDVIWVGVNDSDDEIAEAIGSAMASSERTEFQTSLRSWADVGSEHLAVYSEILDRSSR